MAFKINGVVRIDNSGNGFLGIVTATDANITGVLTATEVDAKVSAKAITEQTEGTESDVTGADELLLLDVETGSLLRVSVDEFVQGAGIGTLITDFDNLTVTGVVTASNGFDGNLFGNSTGNHNGDVYSRTGAEIVLEVPANTGTGSLKANVTGETVSVSSSVTAPNLYGTVEGNVFGNSTGNHSGDVYSRNGSQLVLEVPANTGDAHYIGTVTGDVTGDTTGTHFGTNIGQQHGDVYTADGSQQVVDTAAVPAPVFKGDAEGLTGSPNINVTNVSASSSVTANSFFGDGSGLNNLPGGGGGAIGADGNISVGSTARLITAPTYNVGIGSTLTGNPNKITGTHNTFIGEQAGKSTTSGNNNISIGRFSGGFNQSGSSNVFLGLWAGVGNAASTTGSRNNFLGQYAGFSNASGNENNFLGVSAGNSNSSGCFNNFFGTGAGRDNTTESYNTYIGHSAGYSSKTGEHNNFFGSKVGYSNRGSYNNFFGRCAGYSNTGCHNTFFGEYSGFNSTGSHNTFFGKYAGCNVRAGTNNTFFGEYAGCSVRTGSNNFIVGDITGTIGLSDTIILGTGTTSRLTINPSGAVFPGIVTATSFSGVDGIDITNTGSITYPTTDSFQVTAGNSINLELGTSQTIDPTTPGGYNYVTADKRTYTKSAGTTSDIERLYFAGFGQSFIWSDANTCKQYVGFSDGFVYAGIDANGRTSSYFGVGSLLTLSPPDGGTQTIATVSSPSSRMYGTGTSTINITNCKSYSPEFRFYNFDAGTKTVNITNVSYYDTSSAWGVSGSTGTLNATITNLYGLRLRPPSSTTGLTITNNWGIYQEWTSAKNWFAGASNQFPNITTTASGANAFLDSGDSNRLYRSTSSVVYKKDIEDLETTYADRILDLRPVWYRSKCETDRSDWSWYGFIAEEVAAIDPRLVHYGYQEDAYEKVSVTETVDIPKDDPRFKEGIETEEVTKEEVRLKADAEKVPDGVAYDRFVVPLLDIIKRQQAAIETLEQRLTDAGL